MSKRESVSERKIRTGKLRLQ
uniref:Uncharacterized protein n=1 Tax=Anguilla anguilla TaxID=7936 RepID=A0A0E9RRV7_ANGAN